MSQSGSAYLERHMARLLGSLGGDSGALFEALVAALLRHTMEGHSAASLAQLVSRLEADSVVTTVAECRDALRASSVVGKPGDDQPLILDERDRLYLLRYWRYEDQVASALLERAAAPADTPDTGRLRTLLGQLFPRADESDQKRAAAVAALRQLAVISGGPGTGKTTTVLRLLVMLLQLQPQARVALAAPTGKAAARVSQSIRRERDKLGDTAMAIPAEAVTLHRLLGMRPGTTACRFNAADPLPYDIVIVDEASMIGVAMMARLFDALLPHARLVLLGDKDQLASVEPGSVLGDICADASGFSPQAARELSGLGVEIEPETAQSRLQDCVVTLRHSYRFDASSGIGRLAAAVRDGDADSALAALACGGDSIRLVSQDRSGALADRAVEALSAYFAAVDAQADPGEQLAAFESFRVLGALRHGVAGVRELNRLVEQALLANGRLATVRGWYRGRPVMVTRNDYTAMVFNGDIGVTCLADDIATVVFETARGVQRFATARLPEHQTVYAMTVHKSQGSEFDAVAIVLPDDNPAVLSRELVYTAVTRARSRVEIYGSAATLREAIAARQLVGSGLRDRLRAPAAPTAAILPPGEGPLQTGFDF